ncbi:MAG: TNT domain-containing protein [Bacteroidales bacterium]|nr:TNT domain-containing protein [Bacteroidales bacterium]
MPNQTILEEGTIIDRYGKPDGRYAAPQGTSLDARSLPPNTKSTTLSTYKVAMPLPALEGPAASSFWFQTGGGGTQYYFNSSINQLINEGYLIPIY